MTIPENGLKHLLFICEVAVEFTPGSSPNYSCGFMYMDRGFRLKCPAHSEMHHVANLAVKCICAYRRCFKA